MWWRLRQERGVFSGTCQCPLTSNRQPWSLSPLPSLVGEAISSTCSPHISYERISAAALCWPNTKWKPAEEMGPFASNGFSHSFKWQSATMLPMLILLLADLAVWALSLGCRTLLDVAVCSEYPTPVEFPLHPLPVCPMVSTRWKLCHRLCELRHIQMWCFAWWFLHTCAYLFGDIAESS